MVARYDILKHPNLKYTEDGAAAPYTHSPGCLYNAGQFSFTFTSADEIEIIDLEEESHEE